MDAERFQQAYRKLQSLDERMTYRVRPRSTGYLGHLTREQLEERYRDLANYTIELKETLDELFQAIAGKSGDASAGA